MLQDRKQDHLDIVSQRDVTSRATTGLERYALWHCALPDLSLVEVGTGTTFLGRRLGAPLLISAITGGTPDAGDVNLHLARTAQRFGLAMSVGSQRAGLEQPDLMDTYRVRDVAPDILLMANLGAVQLNYGVDIAACLHAVEAIQADALVLHLNPLQEAIQPSGDTDFRGLMPKIAALCTNAPFPVIVKEVGWGISRDLAAALAGAGVAAIDVAGSGGTSWSRVEAHRVSSMEEVDVALAFDDWGIPTSVSLVQAREACPTLPLIASGGILDGVDMAKCLALGANLVGVARPLLDAARDSDQAVVGTVEVLLRQLQIAMFCLGVDRVSAINGTHVYRKDGV